MPPLAEYLWAAGFIGTSLPWTIDIAEEWEDKEECDECEEERDEHEERGPPRLYPEVCPVLPPMYDPGLPRRFTWFTPFWLLVPLAFGGVCGGVSVPTPSLSGKINKMLQT